MPAKSEKMRRLMAAALHGADFPKAKRLRRSMTQAQLQDFSRDVESHTYDWRKRRRPKPL